ncbi:glycosyltransferase family 61 protein [Promicromonospora sp. MS192]|uniref:glycosyltransferase family 61 protein n=1 Tax=Promicromonospora sp. MS192 TaxID=3412684 RepID=UPI003C2FCA3F
MSDPETGSEREQPAVTRRLLDTLERAAAPTEVRTLVLICDDRPVVLGRRVRERYPGADLTVLSEGWLPDVRNPAFGLLRFDDDHDVLLALAGLVPADLVVDLRAGRPEAVRATFHRAFLTLADGGRYVTRQEPGHRPEDGDLVDEVRELARRRALPAPRRRALSTALELGLGRALAGVAIDEELLVLRKSGEHVIKLGVDDTRAALAARGVEPRVIARVAPERHESASTVWSSDAGLAAERLSGTIEVGELTCTAYDDVLVVPQQVAVLERLLLPTSYFLPWQPARKTFGMRYHGPDFSALEADDGAPADLPGTYYHLDNQVPGHYGHVITHDLSKLWAWDAALAEYPDLKVLLSPSTETGEVPGYTYELLAAFGIGPERVHVITGPVRAERLVTATQAFQQPRFLSPVARDVWARVVAGLLPRAGDAPLPQRVFVSRRAAARRRCLNGDEVERRFRKAGFTVVYPEDLTLPDQARLFSTVTTIAGYAGSGLINTVFSAGPATRVVLASKSYWATNEYHIAALYGGDLHYFWCDPVPPGEGEDGTAYNPFHADYVFDVERDGPALDALLRSLAPRRMFGLSRSGGR